MNIFKAIGFFIMGIFVVGFISLIFSAVIGSSAWDLVEGGFAKSFVVLIPLILIVGILVIAVWKATHRDENQR